MALGVGLLAFVIMLGLILLFAIISNILVIYCVVRMKKLRSVTNVLICNLSFSDILLAGFVMPQRLHDISHTEKFYEGEFLCKIVNFFPVFVITISIYTLVCVSIERRRAIRDSHKQQMTFKSLCKIIPVIWIFSLLVSVPTLVEYSVNEVTTEDGNTTYSFLSCGSQHMSMTYSMINAVFVLIISYILPVVTMFVNYIQLAIFVWQKGRQIHDATTGNDKMHIFKSRIRIVKLLVVVAIIFAASWMPYFVTLLYAKVTHNDASNDANGFVNLFLIALATFSTAYNVVLYVIFNPSFSRAIKQVLRLERNPDNSLDHGAVSTVQRKLKPEMRIETVTRDNVASHSLELDQVQNVHLHIDNHRNYVVDPI